MSGFGWYRPWWTAVLGSDASSKAKLVAGVLATLERSGTVNATARQLARRASLGEKTIRVALAELRDVGWLDFLVADGRAGYVITLYEVRSPGPDVRSPGPDLKEDVRSPAPDGPVTSTGRSGHQAREVRSPGPTYLPTDLATESPAVARARAHGAHPLSPLAKKIADYLQSGVDGLTGEGTSKRPTEHAIILAIDEHDADAATAWQIAVETRAIAQSQDRAPNIAGLYASKLKQRMAQPLEAAA